MLLLFLLLTYSSNCIPQILWNGFELAYKFMMEFATVTSYQYAHDFFLYIRISCSNWNVWTRSILSIKCWITNGQAKKYWNIFLFCCRYVKSRSDKQLRSPKNEDVTKPCEPEARNGNKPIVPCGLVAWSLFNDTYWFSLNNKAVTVNKKDIAWDSDKEYKFGSTVYPKNFQNGSFIGGGHLDPAVPVRAILSLIPSTILYMN